VSRFNTLYLGKVSDAADELELPDSDPEADRDEIRVALINALRSIDQLEKQVANLRKDLNE